MKESNKRSCGGLGFGGEWIMIVMLVVVSRWECARQVC